jgi:hypothetical protein
MFWNVIAKPLIFFAWVVGGRRESDSFKRITFKKKQVVYYNLGKLIKMITRLNGALNGLKGGHNSYDLLLTWNPTFPLIALNIRNEGKKKNYWID